MGSYPRRFLFLRQPSGAGNSLDLGTDRSYFVQSASTVIRARAGKGPALQFARAPSGIFDIVDQNIASAPAAMAAGHAVAGIHKRWPANLAAFYDTFVPRVSNPLARRRAPVGPSGAVSAGHGVHPFAFAVGAASCSAPPRLRVSPNPPQSPMRKVVLWISRGVSLRSTRAAHRPPLDAMLPLDMGCIDHFCRPPPRAPRFRRNRRPWSGSSLPAGVPFGHNIPVHHQR
jgi:hypothetical protein